MAEWEKGKIEKNLDKGGKPHFTWKYLKKNDQPGSIELFPGMEMVSVFDHGGELEIRRNSSRDFEVRVDGKEIRNQSAPPPQSAKTFPGSSPSGPHGGGHGFHPQKHGSGGGTGGGNPGGGGKPSRPEAVIPQGVRCLPTVTSDFVAGIPTPVLKAANPALLWHRLLWTYQRETLLVDSKDKGDFPRFMEGLDLSQPKKAVSDHLDSLGKRMGEAFQGRYQAFDMPLVSPLVHGVGNATPLEVGLTLHSVYGVPYLPGSTLKGIARAWATAVLAEGLAGSNGSDFYKTWKMFDKALDRGKCPEWSAGSEAFELARKVFGAPDRAGRVTFLDAFPHGDFRFKADIMNPHFPDYYGQKKGKAPVENQNPIPVYFLVVSGGVFHFDLLVSDTRDASLLDHAATWLREGLANLGAGGKTSAGYGRFAERKA